MQFRIWIGTNWIWRKGGGLDSYLIGPAAVMGGPVLAQCHSCQNITSDKPPFKKKKREKNRVNHLCDPPPITATATDFPFVPENRVLLRNWITTCFRPAKHPGNWIFKKREWAKQCDGKDPKFDQTGRLTSLKQASGTYKEACLVCRFHGIPSATFGPKRVLFVPKQNRKNLGKKGLTPTLGMWRIRCRYAVIGGEKSVGKTSSVRWRIKDPFEDTK